MAILEVEHIKKKKKQKNNKKKKNKKTILEVEHIKKKFGKTDVLKDISFSLEQGEVLSIIGSSGSGKTTLLRCLNFLEMPDNGIIRVMNVILLDTDKPVTLKESDVRKIRLHF